ncbi:hypothetical protein CMV_003918 [Castanea mollissima]|uniref:Uncharacterized protein n=1 Tax=Castanea mollissima TaxID=60419 RepID=A0A8J4W584_9ROSI|nr:hypothetical protein CMV_003918 [Castanea mollissima]
MAELRASGHILLTWAVLSIHRSSSRHIHDSSSDSPTSPQTSTPRSWTLAFCFLKDQTRPEPPLWNRTQGS